MRTDTQEEGKASPAALLAVYSEICKSYQAIDDFRTKLLGLLPFTSLAGIALLSKEAGLPTASKGPNEPLAFAAVFASAFTLTLFVYEIRGILRCDGLIQRGKDIEKRLHVDGQFWQCAAEMNALSTKLFNTTIAACLVYSLVFAAWIFFALRYGYGIQVFGCAASAVGLGILMGVTAYCLVRRKVPA
jgi:hypothetical protein